MNAMGAVLSFVPAMISSGPRCGFLTSTAVSPPNGLKLASAGVASEGTHAPVLDSRLSKAQLIEVFSALPATHIGLVATQRPASPV